MFKRITAIIFAFVFVAGVVTVALAQEAVTENKTPVVTTDAENKVEPAKDNLAEEQVKETTENKEAVKENTETTEAAKVDKVEEPVKKIAAKVYLNDGKTYVNSSVKFKLSSKDNVELDRVEYKLDGGEIAKYENPFSLEKEGKHTVSYYGIDKSGNNEDAKLLNVIVDNSAPSIELTTTAPIKEIGGVNYISSSVAFSIKAMDNLSGVDKLVYSLGEKNYDYAGVFSVEPSGEMTVKVKAIDNVLNTSEKFSVNVVDEAGKTKVVTVESDLKLVVDNEAPVVSIKADKEYVNTTKKNVVTTDTSFSITAEDKGAGVDKILVKLDGNGKFVEYLGAIKFVKDGAHQIEYKAIDKLGNESNVSSVKVVVDAVAPKTAIEFLD